MKKDKNKIKRTKVEILSEIFYIIVRFISIGMIAFAIVGLVIDFNNRADSRYITIILQAVSMIVLSFVPWFLEKFAKISVPVAIEILFLLFCSCCLLLGEVCDFYIKFKWWDDMLHTFSGSFIACIGFVVISFFNTKDDVPMKMSPGFVVLFVFCLALASECVWEIFEYICDGLFGSNMQRFVDDSTKIEYVGRKALDDTMSDMIEVLGGSLVICILSFIDMKRNGTGNHFVKSLKVKKINHLENEKLNSDIENKENITKELDK